MSLIHPSAIIEDGADIHPSAQIGPFCIVESGAVIGPDCVIESNAKIYGLTRMGRNNRVYHGATIGSAPQDLGYTPDKGKPLIIGDDNHFKECANISHGTKEEHGTIIGSGNYVMSFAHVGHDCIIGDHNILASYAGLGGHTQLGNRIFLSAHVGIHQFCRIGDYVMVGGLSGVRQDVPPYAMINGQYARFVGLNVVGLRRAGFSQTQRTAIKRAYKTLLNSGLKLSDAIEQLKQTDNSTEVCNIVAFLEHSKRGIITAE